MALTMFEKIWARHVVAEGPGGQTLLYVDRHLLHEGSTARLRAPGPQRAPRCAGPISAFATADHYVPTSPGSPAPDAEIRGMVGVARAATRRAGHPATSASATPGAASCTSSGRSRG